MTQKEFEELMSKHGVGTDRYTLNGAGRNRVELRGSTLAAEFGALPTLAFFADLAKLAEVPLESIKVETEDHDDGCDTCGFGGGTTYTVTVPARCVAPSVGLNGT